MISEGCAAGVLTSDHQRFTRRLRALTGLEGPKCIQGQLRGKPLSINQLIDDATKDYEKHFANEALTWLRVRRVLEKYCEKLKIAKLYQYAKDLTLSDDKEKVEPAALFVLQLFLSDTLSFNQQNEELKKEFGFAALNYGNELVVLVRDITVNLDDKIIGVLKSKPKVKKPLFGSEIGYIPNKNSDYIPDENIFRLQDLDGLSEPSNAIFALSPPDHSDANEVHKYGIDWLEEQIKKCVGDENQAFSNLKDCAESVINKLMADKSSEELQYDLCELLGFERLDVIESILTNRDELISDYISSIDRQVQNTSSADTLAKGVAFNCAPDKSQKFGDKMCYSRDKPDGTEVSSDTEPSLMSGIAISKKEQYPHVYDLQRTAKLTAGYVAGKRFVLPDGLLKLEKSAYEEVTIPVTLNPDVPSKNELVEISRLNKIGQVVFQGLKTFNRIQSIVFDTVYSTNNNLLICAPTGSGKTNIALLAVTREIEQNISKGVIQKDAFKIVYVAPMKALAAEITGKFSQLLSPLGLSVKELTGDMQLTKSEILGTQMLITTPEKWDVVTRKGTGDVALTKLVKLLIIDEVHLLHGDRGPVVEALVARTLRQVESSQTMIRIVGLSATLPNYLDVSRFLRVNPHVGLFYFDSRFRPVPLKQTFIGVKNTKPVQQMNDMDNICYDKVLEEIGKGHQVMIFVHTRNSTLRTAKALKEIAEREQQLQLFQIDDRSEISLVKKLRAKLKNKQVGELLHFGISCHHAGMARSDRTAVEYWFANKLIKILVCTSTLAWGVNLPAQTVIIKGTEIYDVNHGSFVDLGILDVLQIFGRAGRPQFGTSGHGIIITTYDKLNHYLSLLTNQFPIESNFIKFLADNLNAEIALGTISNIDEAVRWLSYTYLFIRMRVNPMAYGVSYEEILQDTNLMQKRRTLIESTARALDRAKMIRFNERTGDLNVTDLGRTASHYYIKYDTVEVFNEMMAPIMDNSEILNLVSRAQEFQQLKIRDDELPELDKLLQNYCCMELKGGCENIHGKVNILLQTFLSRGKVDSFSLMSDQSYITQNSVRIARALFEMAICQKNALMASRFLTMSKMFEFQMWDFEHPLKQFGIFGEDTLTKLDEKKLSLDKIREMKPQEVGGCLRNPKLGRKIYQSAREIPMLRISAELQPITRTVMKVKVKLLPEFNWNDRVHGKKSQGFWIWIEEPDTSFIYHSEHFLINKKQAVRNEAQELIIMIPISDPPPAQYLIRAISDTWLGSEILEPLLFGTVTLPRCYPPNTDLLPLEPLPISALENQEFQKIFNFSHFNPIQTQIFHCLYHTDRNVLLGAPTGSGKTVAAELAMLRVFKIDSMAKVVYVAPLKALVRERIKDWKIRFEKHLRKRVVELTGDVAPDAQAISCAHVIVTTPEKWDGISRSWQTRNYVRDVSLIVIDEIHLLGEDRGPVLEVIVSRTNFITSNTMKKIRIVGLSTALANAKDLADWLGIKKMGLFNFRPSVRPVPLEVHISGFPGKNYCPRMATMNRPTFQAIRQHSPNQPALIFVSSRRQTRLTALDLIAHLAGEDNPKQWMHAKEEEMDQIITRIEDSNLKLTLAFGIGLHHAGLVESDRKSVEELFLNQKIQVLVTTATLAWGVNFPAHLVVIKGTEYYDGKLKRYVDMPITDVLQMMGRAGRPQYDDHGVAVILVHDIKKNFYKKFLYEPFPVESSLLGVLPDHLNAEIVGGTIQTKQEAVDYLTWTYFFRRIFKNPCYYNLEDPIDSNIGSYISKVIDDAFSTLEDSSCVRVSEDKRRVAPTTYGRIASYYYLTHTTIRKFKFCLKNHLSLEELIEVLSSASEYSELPVRHNEDVLNGELAKGCPFPVNQSALDSPHTKAQLLFQAHFSRLPMPCSDYYTDLRSVLEQAIRIIQGMIDICADQGWLETTLRTQQLLQMVIQGTWVQASPLLILPHVEKNFLNLFERYLNNLPLLQDSCLKDRSLLQSMLGEEVPKYQVDDMYKVLLSLPILSVSLKIRVSGVLFELSQPMSVEKRIDVPPNEEQTLVVALKRLNNSYDFTGAFTPRFPRDVDEGWFFTLGCREENELVAMKRISGVKTRDMTHFITFLTPAVPGRYIFTLYIFSDCYPGLDTQYSFCLEVVSD